MAHTYRGDGHDRPSDIRVPPSRMAPIRAGRLLKRWRYVAAFSDEVLLCVGSARVGPAGSSWWAAWDRRTGQLHGRTWLRPGRVRFEGSAVLVHDGDAIIELRVDEGDPVETVCPAGSAFTWTRKQADRPVQARVVLPGAPALRLRGRAVVDDSAGYHARHTAWWWSAGVGTSVGGASVGWNLVSGINDPRHGSERSVWVDGIPAEPGPVRFDGLQGIVGADEERLHFTAEATRARRDNLLLIRSDYEQPFGTFAGTLPGGVELAAGMGVMERHDAHW